MLKGKGQGQKGTLKKGKGRMGSKCLWEGNRRMCKTGYEKKMSMERNELWERERWSESWLWKGKRLMNRKGNSISRKGKKRKGMERKGMERKGMERKR